MITLSQQEISSVSNWGRNELIKTLKSPGAFDVFQKEIESGEINVQKISQSLLFKLGARNGQFIIKLQKFLKALKSGEDPDKFNQKFKQERERAQALKNEPKVQTTSVSFDANRHGATQFSRTVLPSADDSKGTVIVQMKFDKTNATEEEVKPKIANVNKDDDITELINDNIADEAAASIVSDVPEPSGKFQDAQQRLLYAREEARMQQIIDFNAPKVSFQPKAWHHLFIIEDEDEHKEEEEKNEASKASKPILVDDDRPHKTNAKNVVTYGIKSDHEWDYDEYSDHGTNDRSKRKHSSRRRKH